MKFCILSNANTIFSILSIYLSIWIRDDKWQKITLPYVGIIKYCINFKKNFALGIRGKKVSMRDAYESYSLLLPPTRMFPSYMKT